MEEQIKLTINSLDLTTEEKDNFYANRIQKREERNVREWRKHLVKLVNTFNQEHNDTNIDSLFKNVGSNTKAFSIDNEISSFSITKTHEENITEGNKFVKLLYLVMKLMYSSFDYLLRLLLKVIFQN